MISRSRAFIAIVAIMFCNGAFAQAKSNEPIKAIHISGRIASTTGAPISGLTVTLRNVTGGDQPLQDNKVITDEKGVFAFGAARGVEYQAFLDVTQETKMGIGTIEIAEGQDVALGEIVLEFTPKNEPVVHFTGPVQIKDIPSMPHSDGHFAQASKAATIAAIYIPCAAVANEFCTGGTAHIILSDGKEVQPTTQKDQVDCSDPFISEDNRTAGWLVEDDYCCASYPIALGLMVYRPGKPLRGFQGDGRTIFIWHFVAGGKQVAFYQDFLHGNSWAHYELRDIETGHLLGKWDGDKTSKTPAWVKRLVW
jgi:hypothetical protein